MQSKLHNNRNIYFYIFQFPKCLLIIFNFSFEPEYYILLFNVSKSLRKIVCNYISSNPDDNYLYSAITLDDLTFIKWWHSNISPFIPNNNHLVCCGSANNDNYIETLEWLYSINPDFIAKDYGICENAIDINNLPALIWLCEHNAPIYKTCLDDGINNHNLEMVQYLHSKGNILNSTHYKLSIRYGTLKITQFVFENMN